MATPPAREPIAVSVLRFVDDRQVVPGAIMTSACTSASVKPTSRHLIHFMPWFRCFQIDYLSEQGGRGTVEQSIFVPEHRVQSWETPAGTVRGTARKR